MGTRGGASVFAGLDTSADSEPCTCREITVCVVDTGGAVLVVAAVVAATVDTEVAVVVDAWVDVTSAVATVMDFSGDDVVGDGAGVELFTGGASLAVFSAVAAGVVDVVCSLEGAAAATGVVTWTPSVVVSLSVFAWAVVVTLADVVAGEGVQVEVGAAAVFAEDAPAT